PPSMVGAEVDVVAVEHDAPTTHSAVRERREASGSRYAAVYPALRAGRYEVAGTNIVVDVTGGRVAEAVIAGASPTNTASPHE
ncbi:MAG TPA: hypothetical protein VGS61_04125, partial [Acidimicrobiales bacterium]|nr:hypothetical protein [Acidimicrobiales bacterium]